MITVELKSQEKIEKDLETTGDSKHLSGIKYVKSVITSLIGLKLELVGITPYLYMHKQIALKVKKPDGNYTHINSNWIKKLTHPNGYVKSMPSTAIHNNKYIKLGRTYMIEITTLKVIKQKSLFRCNECNSIIETSEDLEGLCEECYVSKHWKEQRYTYKPTPIFTGQQIRADIDNPIWYGIELEYGVNKKLSIAQLVSRTTHYLKGDASIASGLEGSIEVVTHPASFTHLMAEDSWINTLNKLDVTDYPENNGCHIHISRTAWKDNRHYALTYYLLYHMGISGLLEQIGGRKFTSYCTLGEPAAKIHNLDKEGSKCKGREVWCNDKPEKTIEFRFFASTTNPIQLKRYIQLLEGVIKYTKYHTKRVTVKGLITYLAKYNSKYKELNEFLCNTKVEDSVVVYAKPRYKKSSINRIKAIDVNNIVTIYTTDGITIKNITESVINIGGNLCGRSNNNYYEITLKEVDTVEVEICV